MREDMRANDALRSIKMTPGFLGNADGSVLIEWGGTRLVCSAMMEGGVPPFLQGRGRGWLTAEYAMLPGATPQRRRRETTKADGRSVEIRRLIGRALRAVVDYEALGENTVYIDCDVIQADGGTRTAAITGAWVALELAQRSWKEKGLIQADVVTDRLAAVSVGMVDGQCLLDLFYPEDVRAQVDMNVVMTGAGELVEVQGTGEKSTFSRGQLNAMLDLAQSGIEQLFTLQRAVLEDACGHE